MQILILGAGASRRMGGRDKLLETVAGQPLLVQVARRALATHCPVTLVLPPDRPQRDAAVLGIPGLRQVIARDAALGMAHSLRAGLTALPADGPVMLVLADMPELTLADLNSMLATHCRHPNSILRGLGQDGTPGHPVVFPGWAWPDLVQLSGDQGARDVLRRHADRVQGVPLPGTHATTDLDTPEDWARWRALGHQ